VQPRRVVLPLWSWSYVAFRFGDGLSSALIPLAIVLHYGQPVWMLALAMAVQNLAAVPATFLWGTLMDRGVRRRPIVVAGFAVAGAAMAVLATLPPFPLFVSAAVVYTVFGVAASPAASTLVLQRVPRKEWSRHTGALSRRTGTSYVLGLCTSILIALPQAWWAKVGDLGAWLGGSPYVGEPHFAGQFAAAAVMAASAAAVAAQTVPPHQPPLPHDPGFDPQLVQASQRRFERPVFFPGRIFHVPTWRAYIGSLATPNRLWTLGYMLTFMGSVCFFASYTGILAQHLLLAPALVLLAQLPSNLVTPVTYPCAGRRGARLGESRGVIEGMLVRNAALPLLCLTVLWGGPAGYPLLLLLHGVLGLSFALIQVNGPVILAGSHPGGRGQGVGTYHAAVGTGTLLGSLSAFLILRQHEFPVSYAFAVAVSALGGLLLWRAHRRGSAAGPPGTVAGPQQAPD
jgi:MFS family permease